MKGDGRKKRREGGNFPSSISFAKDMYAMKYCPRDENQERERKRERVEFKMVQAIDFRCFFPWYETRAFARSMDIQDGKSGSPLPSWLSWRSANLKWQKMRRRRALQLVKACKHEAPNISEGSCRFRLGLSLSRPQTILTNFVMASHFPQLHSRKKFGVFSPSLRPRAGRAWQMQRSWWSRRKFNHPSLLSSSNNLERVLSFFLSLSLWWSDLILLPWFSPPLFQL